MPSVTRNNPVTETTCAYCQEKFTPNPRARTAQRFCSTRCRVYFHREGGGLDAAPQTSRPDAGDASLAAAIAELGPIEIPSNAGIRAITVDRATRDPAGWVVTVPAKSAASIMNVLDQLTERADDLMTLRRKLEQAMKPARKGKRAG